MIQRASLRFQVKNFEKQNRPLLSFGGFYKNWRNSICQVERFDASDTNRPSPPTGSNCQEISASSTNRGSYQLRPWGFFKILRIPKVIIPCLGMKPPDSIVLRHETPKFPILKLVGGGQPTPLNNMKVSWEYYSQYMEK